MANPEHLEILKQGVEQWNAWRKDDPSVQPDLCGADLRGKKLRSINLSDSNLSKSDLRDANLRHADLSRAKLDGARLYRTYISNARLDETSFKGTRLYETVFANVVLSTARHLATCVHKGPSVIDHRTISRSHTIPLEFLRGCGLPDFVIAQAREPGQNRAMYWSCFISYSTRDQKFAKRLYNDLQGNKVRCWFAPHDIKGGRKIHEQIDEAIRLHDRLLLILSEHSMSSEWVKTEIAKARKREVKEGKRVLFPVRLVGFEALRDWECFDADTGKDSAREIREYFIPDFSNWKDHDSYQTAFQRLVSDLKAEAGK